MGELPRQSARPACAWVRPTPAAGDVVAAVAKRVVTVLLALGTYYLFRWCGQPVASAQVAAIVLWLWWEAP